MNNTEIEVIEKIANKMDKKLDYYLNPSINSLDNIFMPLSDHPHIYGLRIAKNFKEYFRDELNAVKIDCYIENPSNLNVIINISNYLFKLKYNPINNKLSFFCNEVQLANLPLSNRLIIVLRVIKGKLFVSINKRRLKILNENIQYLVQDDLCINNLGGEIYLLEIQGVYQDKSYHYKYFGHLNESECKLLYNTSPKYVLEWEKRTKGFYTTLVTCFQLLEYRTYLTKKFVDKIFNYAQFVYDCLMSWPKWRPSSNITAGNSIWETNNWSNGYAPGAFSLSCKILGEVNAASKRKFFEQSTAWFLDKKGVSGLGITQVFPSVVHWKNRSTNHGIVILTTYLLGALLIEGKWTNTSTEIYENLKDIVNFSLKDGSYLESISYFQFIILELMVFFYYLSRIEKISIVNLIKRDFPALMECESFLIYSTNPVTERYFANYGDCENSDEWLYPVKVFFKHLIPTLSFDTSDFYYGLYSIFALEYRCGSDITEFNNSRISYYFFKNNNFFSFFNNKKKYFFWINGSRLHKTHNKDNDLGSFYLSDKYGRSIIKKPGVSIENHNVFSVNSYINDNSEVVLSKNNTQEYKIPRKINGILKIIYEDEENICVSQTNKNYIKCEGKSLISEHVRYFYISKEDNFYLLILDWYSSNYEVKVKTTYNLDKSILPIFHSDKKYVHSRINIECDEDSDIIYFNTKNRLQVIKKNFGKKGFLYTLFSSDPYLSLSDKIRDFRKKILN